MIGCRRLPPLFGERDSEGNAVVALLNHGESPVRGRRCRATVNCTPVKPVCPPLRFGILPSREREDQQTGAALQSAPLMCLPALPVLARRTGFFLTKRTRKDGLWSNARLPSFPPFPSPREPQSWLPSRLMPGENRPPPGIPWSGLAHSFPVWSAWLPGDAFSACSMEALCCSLRLRSHCCQQACCIGWRGGCFTTRNAAALPLRGACFLPSWKEPG